MLALGSIYLAVLLARTAWSWRLAPVCPYRAKEPAEAAVWAAWTEALGRFSPVAADWIGSGPSDRLSLLVASWLPEAILSGCLLALFGGLFQVRERVGPEVPRRIRGFGYAFVGAGFFAVPAQVPDFWLSIAWGRMVLEGINPYTTRIHAAMEPVTILQGLPIDPNLPGMTYGPLWALVSALLCAIGRLLPGSAWTEALLFKAFLAGAWVLVIFLVDRILRDRPLWERAFGLALAGWLPLGPIQAVAEGHNDAVVVLLLALWIATRRARSTFALAASALCKYVTAPLLLLDLPIRRLAVAAILALAALSFAPFLRSLAMFDSALRMRSWRYLTPREAVAPVQIALEAWSGGSWSVLPALAVALPILVAMLATIRWFRHRGDEVRFSQAALAILLAVTLSGLGHVWPWFLLWPLPLAVLEPRAWISRWWLALALSIPFGFGFVIHGSGLPDRLRFDLPSFGCYLLATAVFVSLPARWFPSRRTGTFPHGTG